MIFSTKQWVRSGVALAAAIVLVGSVSACSENAEGTGSGSGSSPDSISFRSISAEGSGLTNYPDVQVGAKAAVDAINRAGGVNGKQIDFSFCNTNGDANVAATCARDAATDSVAAIVGQADIFSTQSTPVLEQAGIPAIGTLGTGAIDHDSPISYPLNSGNYGAFAAAPYAFKAEGKKKMVVVALDFAATKTEADMVDTVATSVGIDNAARIVVPGSGVTDYSPFAQKIKDEGADSVVVLLGPSGLQGLYKAAAGLGVDATFAGTVFSFGESEAQAVGSSISDGILVTSPYPSPADTSVPGIKQYNDDLAADNVSETDLSLRRSAGLNAWLAVYAAAAIAKTIDGPVTAATMTDALKKSGEIDVQGLVKWNPSTLGSAALGSYPRFPLSDFLALTFKDGALVSTDLPSFTDPIGPAR